MPFSAHCSSVASPVQLVVAGFFTITACCCLVAAHCSPVASPLQHVAALLQPFCSQLLPCCSPFLVPLIQSLGVYKILNLATNHGQISDLGDLVNDLSFLDQKDVCEGGQRWRWEAVKGRVVQSVKFYGISDVNVSALSSVYTQEVFPL